jgi:hypothetical protein
MGVSSRHILAQGPMLRTLGGGAVSIWRQRRGNIPTTKPAMPGPEIRTTVPPRSPALVRDYIRNVGGDPASYRGLVPPHLFPQWAFPVIARTLEGIPYPLARVLNGGCRFEINAPIPADRPLHVVARLEDIDDDGRRAVLHQRVITSTDAYENALVADLYAIVPLARGQNGARKERPRVPRGAHELAYFRIGAKAGLDFAKLTGDFNPIHWIPAAARASGFKNVILHGFGTLARTFEVLVRAKLAGDAGALAMIDVRFTRPLVLPASVGVFVTEDGQVFVGDAECGPAYLTGTYETRARGR